MLPIKYFYTLVLSCLLLPSAFASYVSIQGKISQGSDEKISFYLLKNALTGEKIKYVASVGSEGFSIGLEIKTAQIVEVEYGGQKFELFLSPEYKKLDVAFNATSILQTLIFRGVPANDNNFLNFLRKNYSQKGEQVEYREGGFVSLFDAEIVRKAKAYAAEDYYSNLETNYNSQIHLLHNQPRLHRTLFRYLEKEIQWVYETNKIAYILYNRDRLSATDLRRYWVKYALFQTTDLNDESALNYSTYQNLLQSFIHYLYCETPVQSTQLAEEYYRFIQRNLSGKCRYFMLGKLMLDNYYKMGNSSLTQRFFKNYQTYNPYKEYTTTLTEVFGSKLEYVSQERVPNFKVKGMSGEIINLYEYTGKVVYISFWASWCAPCLKNFSTSYNVMQQLEKQGIVFLNVNLDKTETLWKNALARNMISGNNVFALDLSALSAKFKIHSLPFHLCVDKQGRVSYLSSEDLNDAQKDLLDLQRR